MAIRQFSIPPFPASIDRNTFGNWLSGFADGEGHFSLHLGKRFKPTGNGLYISPQYHFSITMREDDIDILRLIQSYWQCGFMVNRIMPIGKKNAMPTARHSVDRIEDLINIVVPHFDAFPLRAKKKEDFLIWRQGIKLAYSIWNRKTRRIPGKRGGTLPRWTGAEQEQFQALIDDLKIARRYTRVLTQYI